MRDKEVCTATLSSRPSTPPNSFTVGCSLFRYPYSAQRLGEHVRGRLHLNNQVPIGRRPPDLTGRPDAVSDGSIPDGRNPGSPAATVACSSKLAVASNAGYKPGGFVPRRRVRSGIDTPDSRPPSASPWWHTPIGMCRRFTAW